MAIRTFGTNAVDWEERVDLDRLRRERLARLKAHLDASEFGALLTFDFSNIRYLTSTHIGTWAMDKLIRFAVLPRGGEPVIWDFGSAARHHQLYNPWLDGAERARAGISTLRGAFHPDAGIAADVASKVATVLREHGVADAPVGVDIVEMPILAALQAEGLTIVDGQQVFLESRRTKTRDEISLLAQACAMVDAAYEELYEFLRPGVRENECVGLVSKVLYDLGSEYVEGVNAISGERCAPHPHVYSDRLIRPGDPAFFDILHSHLGYRTCYYRCFAVGSASRGMRDAYTRCREYMDQAIALVKPGATTADIVALWPRAEEFGFPDEMAAFALQYGHGVGLSIWEKPVFSRLVSLDHPEVLEEGMVFALETYWPAGDGYSAARIEEEVVVTADGCEVITKFPAEKLLIAGRRYWTVDGPLPTEREAQSHLNTGNGRGESMTPEELLDAYAQMALIRRTEKAAHDLFMSGLVKGTTHLAAGHEAVAVGASAALHPDDYVFATYRGHHHALARGATPEECLAELMSRATGLCQAKGGSMHLTKASSGMLGSYAIVGAHLPMAAGAAWSAKLRGSGQVAVAFFGDGATNIGAFHEALNLAAVWSLPVLFVCENNLYMEYTPIAEVTAVANPAADRAAGYNMPGEVLDGNDVVVVHEAVSRAAERARKGDGPSLIEAQTYRHFGHSRADPAKYRPADEVERWLKHDPLDVARARLEAAGVPPETIADRDRRAAATVEAAVEAAKSAPAPDPALAFTDVWADGGSAWRT